jgi:hypothetical protein
MIRWVPCISWTAGQPRPHSWSRLEPRIASLGGPPLALGADIAVPPRFLQIVFTSQGNADCWITRRWETALTDSLNPTLPGPWCGAVAATAILLGTSLVLDQEALHLAMIPVVGIQPPDHDHSLAHGASILSNVPGYIPVSGRSTWHAARALSRGGRHCVSVPAVRSPAWTSIRQ